MKITLPKNSKMLSPDFCYGVATASFQIEGGFESRLPCIWDTFCEKPDAIADNSDGKVACNHINLWQQDLDLIASMGVDSYRFSIAWGRVINQDGSLNQTGVDFYLNLLNRLEQLNIKANVTLYHWDLPQHLEDQGGWLNRQTAYAFADYVRKITTAFGDKVYSYATLNEPFCSAFLGYEIGIHAPGKVGKEYGKKAAHHLLLAHGLAMQVLKQTSPNSQNGIVLNFTPTYPLTNDDADIKAADLAAQHFNHWYIKPIIDGCYPDIIKDLPLEHQPDIQPNDMNIISQAIDFLGINYYTRAVYRADSEHSFVAIEPKGVPKTTMGWEIYPQGFTDLLVSLHQQYQLPPILITENGASMDDKMQNGQVNDLGRVQYFQQHLNAVDQAINLGVDIRGYYAWSLMDNFEWAEGYVKRFGVVYVDYQTQQRTIKKSGMALSELFNSRDKSTLQIDCA